MIRTARLLFCDNEHGTGDVTFPDLCSEDFHQTAEHFIDTQTAKELRKAAKKAGWGVVNGGDYCPGCMDCMREEL